jgi:hypothetical protein
MDVNGRRRRRYGLVGLWAISMFSVVGDLCFSLVGD